MSAERVVPVSYVIHNPFFVCQECHERVHSITDRRYMPCGHTGIARSLCPTWTYETGCLCDERAAERLQAALEEGDAAAIAARRADQVIEQVEQWRPRLWCWIAFAVLVALILGSLATLGAGR